MTETTNVRAARIGDAAIRLVCLVVGALATLYAFWLAVRLIVRGVRPDADAIAVGVILAFVLAGERLVRVAR